MHYDGHVRKNKNECKSVASLFNWIFQCLVPSFFIFVIYLLGKIYVKYLTCSLLGFTITFKPLVLKFILYLRLYTSASLHESSSHYKWDWTILLNYKKFSQKKKTLSIAAFWSPKICIKIKPLWIFWMESKQFYFNSNLRNQM